MKKLAIKSHITRGKEVIELLKMMGGCESGYCGGGMGFYYYISQSGNIEGSCEPHEFDNYIIYTLEEFWEKYPFKVGDKVEVCETGKVFTIGNMIWEDELCTVHYANMEDIEYYTAKELRPYEETNMKENTTLNMSAINYSNGLIGYKIPEGYEFDTVIDNKVVLKKLKLTYPKTVIEVLDYWHPNREPEDNYQYIYKKELIKSVQLLLYCRGAYWKIAGDEMGLGKPWEPNWTTFEGMPAIFRFRYNIVCDSVKNQHCLLVFPTKEMRDAFYENFKDLIDSCKELL